MNRWYDKRPRLGKKLDAFKAMDQKVREPILNEIISLVKKNKPSLLTFEKALDYRFDSFRLRWYEHDPHLWLVFNVLQLADVAILELVEHYLENRHLVT
ncbi:hypothetical protein CXF72_00850 [Psychromonas sp. MB-3u-54]|uniref:hypothetical protein n=1 Tax=Psychromonas sp. MB-3u-54 TaxID=2058319 RepID=UPI000C32DBB8|nr:hypothetical protein [Psychromonas sp. MB-3u-54]PKH04464.1 hypothetical protein CXF72_00850 [Psychromonas sp. MB-3u-54]